MHYLLFLAVLPSIILARHVLAYDRIEKEPAGLLILLFVMGALTCFPAGVLEGIFCGLVESMTDNVGTISRLTYLLIVPLSEEGVKYLALRTTRRNRNFNYTFDGIVYAVIVGLGFATLENILYVMDSGTLDVAIMRGLFSVPLHCTCAVFMGYYYGVARGQEVRGSRAESRRAYRLALVIPCIIHGIFDYGLDTESLLMLIGLLVFVFLVFVSAVRQVRVASANDTPIAAIADLTTPVPAPQKGHRGQRGRGTPPPPFNM